jgi:hypothetical protein
MSYPKTPDAMVQARANALFPHMTRMADSFAHLAWLLRDSTEPEAAELSHAFEAARAAMLTHRTGVGKAYGRWIAAKRAAALATIDTAATVEAQP